MAKIKHCIVLLCPNESDRGKFVGALCGPCHEFITTGKGLYSQAYKNAVHTVIQEIRNCVLKEDHEHNPNDCAICADILAEKMRNYEEA